MKKVVKDLTKEQAKQAIQELSAIEKSELELVYIERNLDYAFRIALPLVGNVVNLQGYVFRKLGIQDNDQAKRAYREELSKRAATLQAVYKAAKQDKELQELIAPIKQGEITALVELGVSRERVANSDLEAYL
jgi:hypothetical protein